MITVTDLSLNYSGTLCIMAICMDALRPFRRTCPRPGSPERSFPWRIGT